jgi:hypothetical protein
LENVAGKLEETILQLNQEIQNFGLMRVNFERDLHSSQVRF